MKMESKINGQSCKETEALKNHIQFGVVVFFEKDPLF